tara:strand:+ start:11231 stop:11524 length:294 start_codon:yes stop_codon:yes gene_type:complete
MKIYTGLMLVSGCRDGLVGGYHRGCDACYSDAIEVGTYTSRERAEAERDKAVAEYVPNGHYEDLCKGVHGSDNGKHPQMDAETYYHFTIVERIVAMD